MTTPYVADSKRGYYSRHYIWRHEESVELKAKTFECALILSSLYPMGTGYDLFWNDGVKEYSLGRLKAPINRTLSGTSTKELQPLLDGELNACRAILEGRVFNIEELSELNRILLKYSFLESRKIELVLTIYGIES